MGVHRQGNQNQKCKNRRRSPKSYLKFVCSLLNSLIKEKSRNLVALTFSVPRKFKYSSYPVPSLGFAVLPNPFKHFPLYKVIYASSFFLPKPTLWKVLNIHRSQKSIEMKTFCYLHFLHLLYGCLLFLPFFGGEGIRVFSCKSQMY